MKKIYALFYALIEEALKNFEPHMYKNMKFIYQRKMEKKKDLNDMRVFTETRIEGTKVNL